MPTEKVWYRFEAKRNDGSVLKLRIQDLPPARVKDAIDLMVKYFLRDESVNRAVGLSNNPIAVETRRKKIEIEFSLLLYHVVICCRDDSDDVKDIMGVSIMKLVKDQSSWIENNISTENKTAPTKEEKKKYEIMYEYLSAYDPIKEFNPDSYYIDKGLVVAPEYRRLGIAEKFFKVRRMICQADGVPMTGGWMTSFGTQKAAARDGWETVCELDCQYLENKYDVTFTDAPPTFKFMLTKITTSATDN